MISDDLSSLFGPGRAGPALAASYRQGVILSFSTVDGTNTVSISGAVLANVPMLLTGAEIQYSTGDRVVLMVLGNTYLMVGKVAVPGGTSYASASQASASASNSILGVGLSTSFGVIASTSLAVPPWANQASVTLIGSVTAANPSSVSNAIMWASVQISGASATPLFSTGVLPALDNPITCGDVQTVAVTPGGTLTGSLSANTNVTFTAVAANAFTVRLMAIFRKV